MLDLKDISDALGLRVVSYEVNYPKLQLNSVVEGATLADLLEEIEFQEDPRLFKEAVLGAIQVYFDGLVERNIRPRDPEIWDEQLEALNRMLTGVRKAIVGFYRENQVIPFDEVREMILPYDSRLIKYASKEGYKRRHLIGGERQVKDCAISIVNALGDDEVDLIVPIASGGFEPAALIADYLKVDRLFPVRYSGLRRADRRVLVPSQAHPGYPKEQIFGNNVLLIDDIVATGATSSRLVQWITEHSPSKIYFGVICSYQKDLSDSCLQKHKGSEHLYNHLKKAV